MTRFFHLRAGDASFAVDARPADGGLPRILHFGPDLGVDVDGQALVDAAPASRWGARLDNPRPPCVLPGAEAGHFGLPALAPAHGLQLTLHDAQARESALDLTLVPAGNTAGRVVLSYRLSPHGVLSARASLQGTMPAFAWLAALALPLPERFDEVLTFGGDWAREFSIDRQALGTTALVLESRRGRPGHDRFPGLFVGTRGFGEDHGDVLGASLGWSGSHRLSLERLREGPALLLAGELPGEGEFLPASHQGAWCHVVHSTRGLNGAMQAFHAFLREEVLPASVAARPRPVHYNTWEALYFRHDMATLKDLVDRAARVGAERFVLDDGWFRGRHDDRAGLGDWTVDAAKYPAGLAPLIQHVHARGLEFGLWVEPEMVNPDSDLARAHPDWIRRDAGGLVLQRNQAVLDMARDDVRAHLFAALDRLLADHAIAYLKWDMNRDLTGPGHHAHVLGVHALVDQLRAAHPRVEIETCASGGGRCDFGMLSRAERAWVSDSNDALDRFDIQRNANLFLPPEVSGVHVGPATCHITGRRLSLDLRAHVAIFGHMGLELDLRELDADGLARLAGHVETYKRLRPLLHGGCWWRVDTSGPDHAAVAASAADGREALCLVVRTGSRTLGRGTSLRVPGLLPGPRYRVVAAGAHAPHVERSLGASLRSGKLVMGGQVLATRGLDLYLPRPESSLLLHFEAT